MFLRTRDVSRIPCASRTRVARLPRERDDFALLICDLRQKRYTQSVRPLFRQAMNVGAHEPLLAARDTFFSDTFLQTSPAAMRGVGLAMSTKKRRTLGKPKQPAIVRFRGRPAKPVPKPSAKRERRPPAAAGEIARKRAEVDAALAEARKS